MHTKLFLPLLILLAMFTNSALAFRANSLLRISSKKCVNLVRSSLTARSAVTTTSSGQVATPEYRLHFFDDGKPISPWHDIPLKNGEFFNFIAEIPKFGKAKMEVATKEKFNPIAQDVKKGKLRDYHGPIFWNYGCLPQTWEDPNVLNPAVNCKGDNDPLDVVEIGSIVLPTGTITPVKILGVLAMVDDGELDWKLIAINSKDPLAAQLDDISDVESKMPGVVSGIREWFRWYKTPDDKPLNKFGFDEKALNKAKALEVIEETHHHWKQLRQGKSEQGKLWLK